MKVLMTFLSATLAAGTLFAQTTAVYEVPVADESLKPFSVFKVESLATTNDGTTSVKYKLPRELTGRTQSVEFKGTFPALGEQTTLAGSKGEMACEGLAAGIQCTVKYENLRVDANRRTQILEKISNDATEFKARLEVARGFDSDPIGIMTWPGAYGTAAQSSKP